MSKNSNNSPLNTSKQVYLTSLMFLEFKTSPKTCPTRELSGPYVEVIIKIITQNQASNLGLEMGLVISDLGSDIYIILF